MQRPPLLLNIILLQVPIRHPLPLNQLAIQAQQIIITIRIIHLAIDLYLLSSASKVPIQIDSYSGDIVAKTEACTTGLALY